MLKDIIEDTQLFMLGAWNGVIDAVSPQPAKREAIRVGMRRLGQARGKYRELNALLRTEERQLTLNQIEERKLLAEKHKGEQFDLRVRHQEARAQGKAAVREMRTAVLTEIVGASPAKAAPAVAKSAKRPTRASGRIIAVPA